MTLHERFEESQRAMERSVWKGRQSAAVYEASKDVIARSIRLVDTMRRLASSHETTTE